MKLVFKFLGLIILAALLLVAALLVTLRYQPDWIVGVINNVQTAAKIDAQGLEVEYFPPLIRVSQVDIAMATQDVAVHTASARLNPQSWWSDTPFWGIDLDRVAVSQRSDGPAPIAQEPSGSLGVLNIMPYLTFDQIRVGELTVTGAAPLSAQFSAQQNGRDIVLAASGEAAGSRFQLHGDIVRRSSALGFVLTIEAANDAQDPIALSAELSGALESGTAMQLDLDAGEAKVLVGDTAHKLANLTGKIALTPLNPGDEISFYELAGSYLGPAWQEDLPFSATGAVTLLAAAVDVDANATVGASDAQLKLQGNTAAGTWKGNVALESSGLHSSVSIAPYQNVDLFPLQLSSTLQLSPTELTLTDLQLESPANALGGTVRLGLGASLKLIANLVAQRLYLPLVGSEQPAGDDPVPAESGAATESEAAVESEVAAVAAEDEPGTPDAMLFSADAIDWSWIEAAEIDVQLKAQTLRLQEANFERLDVAVRNENGVLSLSPISAQLGDGGFEGTVTLELATAAADASELAPITAQAQLDVQGIALESFGFVPQEELRGGALEVALKLDANGRSARDLASSLDGDILAMVEDATLMNDFVELAGSDLLMETLNKLNPFAKQDPTTELNCALVLFAAEDGELRTENQLVMETSKMEIVGNGSIDLNTEKLDIGFTPNAKSGVGINIGSLVKFLKVGGTLSAPRPAADAGGLLKSGLAIGAAISTGGASVVAEGLAKRALSAGSACDAVRNSRSAP